jgi:hypothetical protein
MTGRTQTLPWWHGEKGYRRQKTKYISPVAVYIGLHAVIAVALFSTDRKTVHGSTTLFLANRLTV